MLRFNWRSALIYTHRWLGITGFVFFVVWFFSGIVMMYARMPRLTAEERLARMAPLDLSAISVSPEEAARNAGVSPERLRIAMLAGRPVYRFLGDGYWSTVFADTGRPLEQVTAADAVEFVKQFVPEHASSVRYDAHLFDSDQWTLSAVIRAHMPMHRIAVGDPDGTHLYVSERTGEAVMKTTSHDRPWAYLGAVLHYTYFTPFRRLTNFWTQTIICLGLIGFVMCLLGLVTGIWRFSASKRFRLKGEHSHSPYSGLLWWHHYAGLIFGLASATWALSGALSLNPWSWSPSTSPTAAQRDAVAGGPLRVDAFTRDRLRAAAAAMKLSIDVRELEALQFDSEPYLMANRPSTLQQARESINTDLTAFLSPQLRLEHLVVSATSPEARTFARFTDDVTMKAARMAMPGVEIEDAVWLENYDTYYYDRRQGRTLPVLRVRYLDPQRTWLYVDPRHGLIAQKQERLTRLNRWLYHGLHSLDFPFLYYRRPAWDVVVIVLSVGGMFLSVSTIVATWRRLRRHVRRLQRAPIPELSGSRLPPNLEGSRPRG